MENTLNQVLTPEARALYQRLLNHESVEGDTPGLAELLARGVASRAAARRGDLGPPYIALPPPVAEQVMRNQLVEQASTYVRQIHALPDLLASLQALAGESPEKAGGARLAPRSAGSTRVLPASEVSSVLERLVAKAQSHVAVMQPGPRPVPLSDPVTKVLRAAAARGVMCRVLFDRRSRHYGPTADWARRVIGSQVEISTTTAPFNSAVAVDWSTVAVPVSNSNDGLEVDAWLVDDQSTVHLIQHWFTLRWAEARPWTAVESGATLTTPLQRKILRGLLAGRSQADVAKELNVTPTYANRQLNELRQDLNLQNLAQLVAWWVQSEESLLSA